MRVAKGLLGVRVRLIYLGRSPHSLESEGGGPLSGWGWGGGGGGEAEERVREAEGGRRMGE